MSGRSADSSYPRAVAVPLDAIVRSGDGGAESLFWRIRAAGVDDGFARGEVPDGCLAAFLALEAAPAAAFPEFARRWGVLGTCAEHGLPGVHAGCAPREGELAHLDFNFVSMTEGWTVPLRIYQEPLAPWRATAAALAATRRLSQALHDGSPGDPDDVARLFGDAAAAVRKPALAVGDQRTRLSALANGWLRDSAFGPRFTWPFTASKPELVLDSRRGAAADGELGFCWPPRSLYSVLLTQFFAGLADARG